jgi:hypothetical protein
MRSANFYLEKELTEMLLVQNRDIEKAKILDFRKEPQNGDSR